MNTARCSAGLFHPGPWIRWLRCGLPSFVGVWLSSADVASSIQPPPLPPNDYCTNAIVIPANQGFPQLTSIIGDISGATNEEVSVSTHCWFEVGSFRSLWYRFAPANSGTFEFSTAEGTATYENLDTKLAVFEAPDGCGGLLTLIHCNDNGKGRAKMFANLSAGRHYLVYVAVAFPDIFGPDGTNTVQLRVDGPWAPPSNDACANACVIPTDAVFPYWTPLVDIAAAGNEMPMPLPECQTAAVRSIWFKFRSPNTSRYALSTCFELTANQVADTLMAVYEAPNGCRDDLTPVECIDDDQTATCGNFAQSHIETLLTAGMDYFIVVWQWYAPIAEDPVVPGNSFVQLYLNDLDHIRIWNQNLGGGFYHILFPALTNRTYHLEGSSNLTSWTRVATNWTFFRTNSFFEIDPSDPALQPQSPYQFFRIQVP